VEIGNRIFADPDLTAFVERVLQAELLAGEVTETAHGVGK
jgi:hypothetical protein